MPILSLPLSHSIFFSLFLSSAETRAFQETSLLSVCFLWKGFSPPAFILFMLYFRSCSKVSLWEDKYSQGYQWRPVRSVRERGYKGKHSFSLAHSWITEPIDFLYLSTAPLVSESLERHWRLCLFSYRCSPSAYTGVHIHIFCCSSPFMHLFSQVAEQLQEQRGFFIRYYSLLRKGRNWKERAMMQLLWWMWKWLLWWWPQHFAGNLRLLLCLWCCGESGGWTSRLLGLIILE